MEVLKVNKISKDINNQNIIKDISFSIKKGDVFGFIGRNGSGKTTTIRMILGLIKPTSGSVFINGYNVENDFSRAMQNASGIVEIPTFYGFLTGWENLQQKSRLFNLGNNVKEIKRIVKLIGLEDGIHRKAATYSLGMKQRLAIGIALIGDPELIILDEPINGLDPQGIIEIRNLIDYLATEKQKAILISSHILSELELIINKGIIIDKGQIVMDLHEHLHKAEHVKLVYKLVLDNTEDINSVVTILTAMNIKIDKQLENSVHFTISHINKLQEIVKKIMKEHINISEIIKTHQTLEELYLDVTTNEEDK